MQHDYVEQLLNSVASSSVVIAQRRFASVAATIDAVIYQHGTFAGPDRFQLVLRYQCLRDAERDEAASVLRMREANTPTEDVLGRLHQDVEHGRAVKTSPTRRDRATLYALYQGREAQQLLMVHKKGGERAFWQRAELIGQFPRKTLTPLLAESSK